MKKKLISIIIATYNGEKFLKNCLLSVFKSQYDNFEVIIIDDGSTDRSSQILKTFGERYKFKLIKNNKNLGLAESRNKGINKAVGEILVFLDNDSKVDKNWLKGIEETFSSDRTIGAIQCKILDFKKREIIQEIGMKIVPYTGFGIPLARGQKDYGQFVHQEEIISLGAALAVKKEIAKKIGYFDRKLFHYTDDLDFSWRVWIAGYRVVLAPNARIYHYTKIHPPTYKLYFHLCKNSLRMLIKNYETLNIIKYVPISILFNIAGSLRVFFRKSSIAAILGFLMGFFWNLLFLTDTLRERARVQHLRRVSDEAIFKKVMIPANIINFLRIYLNRNK